VSVRACVCACGVCECVCVCFVADFNLLLTFNLGVVPRRSGPKRQSSGRLRHGQH
jgi:hypothetical protein